MRRETSPVPFNFQWVVAVGLSQQGALGLKVVLEEEAWEHSQGRRVLEPGSLWLHCQARDAR